MSSHRSYLESKSIGISIVRAGANTLHPYRENPPDRLIQPDDIVFFDFGPIFEDWEADLGRTYVLGNDPIKARIRHDIEAAWHVAKAHFMATPDITSAALYRFVVELTHSLGWENPQAHCGHLIGKRRDDVRSDGETGSHRTRYRGRQ